MDPMELINVIGQVFTPSREQVPATPEQPPSDHRFQLKRIPLERTQGVSGDKQRRRTQAQGPEEVSSPDPHSSNGQNEPPNWFTNGMAPLVDELKRLTKELTGMKENVMDLKTRVSSVELRVDEMRTHPKRIADMEKHTTSNKVWCQEMDERMRKQNESMRELENSLEWAHATGEALEASMKKTEASIKEIASRVDLRAYEHGTMKNDMETRMDTIAEELTKIKTQLSNSTHNLPPPPPPHHHRGRRMQTTT